MVTAPVTPFPDAGEPEGAVLGGIREQGCHMWISHSSGTRKRRRQGRK